MKQVPPLRPRPPFWQEAAFGVCRGFSKHVDGVTKVVSGYAGGDQATADYELVSSGTTGRRDWSRSDARSRKISYGHLLQIYFSVAHDPTQLDRQGPDHGTQYRSAIFPVSAEQERVAKAYIVELDRAKTFASPIVTQIDPNRAFYPAEESTRTSYAPSGVSLYRLQRPAEAGRHCSSCFPTSTGPSLSS